MLLTGKLFILNSPNFVIYINQFFTSKIIYIYFIFLPVNLIKKNIFFSKKQASPYFINIKGILNVQT